MARVERTKRSRLDLSEMWLRIAADSVSNADTFLEAVQQRVAMLAENPLAGRARPDLAQGLRSFPHGNYLIIYRPLEDGIRLLRVVHGGRELGKLFEN